MLTNEDLFKVTTADKVGELSYDYSENKIGVATTKENDKIIYHYYETNDKGILIEDIIYPQFDVALAHAREIYIDLFEEHLAVLKCISKHENIINEFNKLKELGYVTFDHNSLLQFIIQQYKRNATNTLVNEDLFLINNLENYHQLNFSDEGDVIGIATNEVSGTIEYIIYKNNKDNLICWQEKTLNSTYALNKARKLYHEHFWLLQNQEQKKDYITNQDDKKLVKKTIKY